MYLAVKRCRRSCSTVGGWILEEFREFFAKGEREIQKHTTPFKHVPCHLGIFFPIDALDSDREGLKLFYCISRGLLSGFLIDICRDILSCETYVYIYIVLFLAFLLHQSPSIKASQTKFTQIHQTQSNSSQNQLKAKLKIKKREANLIQIPTQQSTTLFFFQNLKSDGSSCTIPSICRLSLLRSFSHSKAPSSSRHIYESCTSHRKPSS